MKQITIVAPLEDGLVARISQTLGDADLNIESLEALNTQDRAVVTLTVDSYDDALRSLCDAGFHAITEDAVVINVRDEPGALAKVTRRLYEGGVHVHSIRILYRQFGEGLVAVAMDDNAKGIELIGDLLVKGRD